MASAFSTWVGQPVVLQVAAGEMRIPLHGTVLGESEDAIRVRVGEGWDVDIFKTLILAVEEANWVIAIT